MAEFFPVVFYEIETVGLLSSLELLLETLKHPCEQLREEAAKIELAGVLSRLHTKCWQGLLQSFAPTPRHNLGKITRLNTLIMIGGLERR